MEKTRTGVPKHTVKKLLHSGRVRVTRRVYQNFLGFISKVVGSTVRPKSTAIIMLKVGIGFIAI